MARVMTHDDARTETWGRAAIAASDPAPTHYVFDQTESDHERLIRQAQAMDGSAREACLRAGLRRGHQAIDVGCGPLGTLPLLAELVGPDGAVVGIDMNADALRQARHALDALGLHAVHLVESDLTSLRPELLAPYGPFDLAFCRFVLKYQADPAATLRRIAALVRPGGKIVAMDVLRDPCYPSFVPPVPAAEAANRLFFALVAHKGGTVEVARHYPALCAEAGLHLVEQRGLFGVADDPGGMLAHYRDILLSMRGNLVAQGLATEEVIETLAQEMDAARDTVHFGASSLLVEMIAEVP